MPHRPRLSVPATVAALATLIALAIPSTARATDPDQLTQLVPGTAVLLDQSSGTGNGGNAKTASSSTNIFAPGTFVDYKRFGGEPTVVVDRYPFRPGQFGCPGAPNTTPCAPRDLVYQSAPQGFVFPHYSQFYKSDDLGQSFRKPRQFPIYGLPQITAGGGGGDSHLAVGKITHDVYFVDLTLFPGITVNVSHDLGETFPQSDPIGTGLSFLDDRQWVEADEDVNRVYVSTNNLLNPVTPVVAVFLNTTGAPVGGFATSPCNPGTFAVGSNIPDPSVTDSFASPCPDPADPYLWVSGPVVADKEGTPTRPPTHDVYIPFVRRISHPLGTGLFGIDAWQLYVAKSTDHGATWTRHKVADLPADVDPANIFVQLTIDRGGNLYYTWSQAQSSAVSTRQKHTEPPNEEGLGEQDIYYTFSTAGGIAGSWAAPIDLTPEANDSAIFPWMVAGDPGKVDLTYYKSNSGANSNVAPPDTVWNTYFGQSQNALNTGSNFKSVQVTAQPNHIGGICTGGVSCSGDRDLLDFITIDVDHLGAAHIAYSDDNRRRDSDTQDLMTRQIAGNSVFKDQNITLQSSWPIHDHAVTDRTGDVFDTTSSPRGSCPGMDLSRMTVDRAGGTITATLTLNGAPTSGKAVTCGVVAATGGLWGVEFWAASDPATFGPSNRFYIAYHDNPLDGAPSVEGGTIDQVNATVTSLEFHRRVPGTLGGTCLPSSGPPATGTCTISLTVAGSSLGITPGNALNNVTGLSVYLVGNLGQPVPATRVVLGNSEQADATAPMDFAGSGTP